MNFGIVIGNKLFSKTLIGLGLTRKQIAYRMEITDYALKRKMRNLNLSMRSKYSSVNDSLLRELIVEIAMENDQLGRHFSFVKTFMSISIVVVVNYPN